MILHWFVHIRIVEFLIENLKTIIFPVLSYFFFIFMLNLFIPIFIL